MDLRKFENTCTWILSALYLVLWIQDVRGQSCGPRVSARLLAEIPCDMSKSSYCSAPGSAYPWNSVKRYINDNQGLVRRMYGDEKHSSVLLNEIDGIRLKFEQLRSYISRGYSRTEYGRSARGSRRQPRPQIFDDDDDETPATIFRVVTETSIKVGDPVTRPMTTETVSTTYESTTVDYDSTTPESTLYTTTVTTSESSTTQLAVPTEPSTTETERDTVLTTAKTTQTTSEASTTVTTPQPTTSTFQDIPVAMQRIGHDDRDDYDYEPDRKAAASVHQNSVEEKAKSKQESSNVKRNDLPKYDDEASMYMVVADASTDQPVSNDTETKAEEEEETEEIPRRGINACPVKNEVIAPYWANNTRGETLALLNVHPFEQYVHFEKCAFENHQMLCREGCRCEQQYRLHRLLAFDPKNECRGIFSDWFRFPSCCVCICYDITPDIPRTRSRKGRMK